MKDIYDPIYGYIEVSDDELDVINHPKVQRLRRISQLGLVSCVYPGATHSRFEHSLGVMHLSEKMARSANLSNRVVKSSRIAGLLHDAGHLPFSHTLEDLIHERTGFTHEDLSCRLVNQLEDIIDDDVDIELVNNLIRNEADCVNVVSNEIDTDRIDYLRRDSDRVGTDGLGRVDAETLIKFVFVEDNTLGYRGKALQAVDGLLIARLLMTRSVYKHDTVLSAEAMLEKSVRSHLEYNDISPKRLFYRDEPWLRQELRNSNSDISQSLYRDMKNRNLYKIAYIQRENLPDMTEKEYLNEISNISNTDKNRIIVKLYDSTCVDKFTTPIDWRGEIKPLEDVSTVPESLRSSPEYNQKLVVYAEEKSQKAVSKACNRIFES